MWEEDDFDKAARGALVSKIGVLRHENKQMRRQLGAVLEECLDLITNDSKAGDREILFADKIRSIIQTSQAGE